MAAEQNTVLMATPADKTANKDQKLPADDDAPRPKRELSLPRATIIAAIISGLLAGGSGIVVGLLLPGSRTSSGQSSGKSATVSISSPSANARIPRRLVAQGTARNLGPQQLVWLTVEAIRPGGAYSGQIYLSPGPCPVKSDGTWSCGIGPVGNPGGYGTQWVIWATVVNAQQANQYINRFRTGHGDDFFTVAGRSGPPHVGGSSGITHILVIRCARQGCHG